MFKLILEKKKLCYHKKIIYLILHKRILKRFKLEKKTVCYKSTNFLTFKTIQSNKNTLENYFKLIYRKKRVLPYKNNLSFSFARRKNKKKICFYKKKRIIQPNLFFLIKHNVFLQYTIKAIFKFVLKKMFYAIL